MQDWQSGRAKGAAASQRTRGGPCTQVNSTLCLGRGASAISPRGSICAVASLIAPGTFLRTWLLPALPSAIHFSCPPSQSCLSLPRTPRVSLSPGQCCCSCGCLTSCLGALLGAPPMSQYVIRIGREAALSRLSASSSCCLHGSVHTPQPRQPGLRGDLGNKPIHLAKMMN